MFWLQSMEVLPLYVSGLSSSCEKVLKDPGPMYPLLGKTTPKRVKVIFIPVNKLRIFKEASKRLGGAVARGGLYAQDSLWWQGWA